MDTRGDFYQSPPQRRWRAEDAGGEASAGPDDHGHAHGPGGHSHGADEVGSVALTLFTPEVEMFVEYPHLVQGENAEFLAHFTLLHSGDPVRSGSLRLEVSDPAGSTSNTSLGAPDRPGIFVLNHVFPSAGVYSLKMIVESADLSATFDLTDVTVHPDLESAGYAAEAAALEDDAGHIDFLMEQQWRVQMRLAEVREHDLVDRLQVPAEIKARHHDTAIINAPVSGRLLSIDGAGFPEIGGRVEQGQPVAIIEPPLPVTQMVQLSVGQLELLLKAIEIDRALLQAEARLEFAQKQHVRAREMSEQGVGSMVQMDEALQALQLAQSEYNTATLVEEAYDNVLVGLVGGSDGEVSLLDLHGWLQSLQLRLFSPISGKVVWAECVEGMTFEAHQPVMRIINTSRVWVEGQVSEFDLVRIGRNAGAVAKVAGLSGHAFDIPGGPGRGYSFLGSIVDPLSRTVVVRFDLDNPDDLLRIGMLAELFIETDRALDCVAVPEESIVIDRGVEVVYVLLGGETFERREIRSGIRDRGLVEIAEGVRRGERVVSSGANVLRLSAAATETIGHGHVH